MQDKRLPFRIVDQNLEGMRWIDVLGRIHKKKGIMVISRFEIEITPPRQYKWSLFNQEMKELLLENKLIGGYDTLVKNGVIGEYWRIMALKG